MVNALHREFGDGPKIRRLAYHMPMTLDLFNPKSIASTKCRRLLCQVSSRSDQGFSYYTNIRTHTTHPHTKHKTDSKTFFLHVSDQKRESSPLTNERIPVSNDEEMAEILNTFCFCYHRRKYKYSPGSWKLTL